MTIILFLLRELRTDLRLFVQKDKSEDVTRRLEMLQLSSNDVSSLRSGRFARLILSSLIFNYRFLHGYMLSLAKFVCNEFIPEAGMKDYSSLKLRMREIRMLFSLMFIPVCHCCYF